jgi:hypothetical protein
MITIDKILEKQRAWQAVSADDEPVIRAMAAASLAKCAEAVSILGQNLSGIGYPWVTTEPVPARELAENIQLIEGRTGLSIARVLVEFWKIIGGVSFVDLETYRHVGFWSDHQITAPGGFADGLHVDACSKEWAVSICQDFEDWKNYRRQDGSDRFLISLSPDGFHKDNISGGMPYGLWAGPSWKPIWRYFEWSGAKRPATAPPGPPDFLSYLRTTLLECAGFPALLGSPAFDTLREKLLEGVPVF